MTNDHLHFLVVEDTITDSFLIQRQLSKLDDDYQINFTYNLLGLQSALSGFIPDIVITDFNLINFNALDVIKIVR